MGIFKKNSYWLISSLVLSLVLSVIFAFSLDKTIFYMLALSLIPLIIFFLREFFYNISYEDSKSSDYLKYWYSSFRYYSGVGYSLLGSGIVLLFTSSFDNSHLIGVYISIFIAGIFFAAAGEKNKQRADDFKEWVIENEKSKKRKK